MHVVNKEKKKKHWAFVLIHIKTILRIDNILTIFKNVLNDDLMCAFWWDHV